MNSIILRSKSILFTGIVLFLLISPLVLNGQSQSPLYQRAPTVLDGTLPEMRQTSYWIGRMEKPDEVVMQQADILKMNQAYNQKMKDMIAGNTLPNTVTRQFQSFPGRIATRPDLSVKTSEELAVIARDMINTELKYLRGKPYGNIQGIPYDAAELDELADEMAVEGIKNQITIRDGITVKYSRLRIIPALRDEYIGLSDIKKTRWDMWNLDIVPAGSHVEVVHISKSGGHLFVLTDRGYGWMRSEEVAFDKTSAILEFCQSKNFLVCTGDMVPYYSGEDCQIVSGLIRMGDRLPAGSGNNPAKIKVPTRKLDGKLLIQEAWLAKNADVHAGYVPYTRKNVVELSFKLMDNLYDWTGGWYGRNHITQLRDCFRCFGFEFPAIGELLAMFNDNGWTIAPDKGKEVQYKAMFSNEPFLTIQISSGHSQLYLGEEKGEPYVFDTHGYGYTNPDGAEYEIRRTCIGNLTQPAYFLKNPIYFVTINNQKK